MAEAGKYISEDIVIWLKVTWNCTADKVDHDQKEKNSNQLIVNIKKCFNKSAKCQEKNDQLDSMFNNNLDNGTSLKLNNQSYSWGEGTNIIMKYFMKLDWLEMYLLSEG